DHSEVEPPLPIPNRSVKRLSADDSADSCAKVGHRQAPTSSTNAPLRRDICILGCVCTTRPASLGSVRARATAGIARACPAGKYVDRALARPPVALSRTKQRAGENPFPKTGRPGMSFLLITPHRRRL